MPDNHQGCICWVGQAFFTPRCCA